MMYLPQILTPLLLLLIFTKIHAATKVKNVPKEETGGAVDNHGNCGAWAEMGECDKNVQYMRSNCIASCNKYDEEMRKEAEEVLADFDSFHDLEADDIDGNLIKFDAFKGKVVVVTNVASECGYTESHYRGLVQLHKDIMAVTNDFEILAFPCNQFGSQEPDECPKIKQFALDKGVKFRMMYKIDVNGDDAHLVYKYLKHVAGGGVRSISWNFGTYFLIGPDGKDIRSFSNVEPMVLKEDILELIRLRKEQEDEL